MACMLLTTCAQRHAHSNETIRGPHTYLATKLRCCTPFACVCKQVPGDAGKFVEPISNQSEVSGGEGRVRQIPAALRPQMADSLL